MNGIPFTILLFSDTMSCCRRALTENMEYSELNNRGKRMTILVNNAVSLLDVLLVGESIVEDTYMLSHAAPHHPTVTCSKLHVVTCVSHDTVTYVTYVTVTPAPCPSQWPTESMQLLGLSTSNTAAFPLKTIIG